jgi:ABC-type branched-subunit amino acid transport system substrate-binding protein
MNENFTGFPLARARSETCSQEKPHRAAEIAVLLFVLLTCSRVLFFVAAASEIEVLNIGVLLPPEEPQSQSLREGILLAQEHANRGTNRLVHVSIRGRTGQWGADAVEAARLVSDEGAHGLIAPPDGAASHVVLQVSGRTAVPVVTLCPDGSVGHTGVPWMLRMVPTTENEAVALFRGAFETSSGRGRRWIAVVPDKRPGREIGSDLREAALAADCILDRVVEVATLTNCDEIVARALSNRPEGILLWLPPKLAGMMARGFRSAGFPGPLCGPSRLQCRDFFNTSGGASDGFMIAALSPAHEVRVRRTSFETAFSQRWGHEADAAAMDSYDAAMVLIHLLTLDEFENPPHRLPSGFCWSGVTGDISFDSSGNRKAHLSLLRVRDRHFVMVNGPN